ncbi:MAG: hypothetical protein HWN81_04670 [Candidatus Lokiarchaeota archaeon]|nr:hypothetical protein [Candidatus Lokiarchaeota archaeon]
MSNKITKKETIRKKLLVQLVVLVIYLIILLYFYYFFFNFGANPLIIILLIVFTFLMIIGPFLRKNKRSLYSRMFPDRKRKPSLNYKRKLRPITKEKELNLTQQRIFKPVNLDFNYRKPIIKKCENCGNIVPSFVKTCPFCKKQIIQ